MNAATLPSELKAARGSSLRTGDFAHRGRETERSNPSMQSTTQRPQHGLNALTTLLVDFEAALRALMSVSVGGDSLWNCVFQSDASRRAATKSWASLQGPGIASCIENIGSAPGRRHDPARKTEELVDGGRE